MEEIKFSIVTPVFNRANLLRNLFVSICNQNIKEKEWIIVDDGSTDGCYEIIKSFSSDFLIRYYYQENSGKHVALNLGVANACGVFTVIIDSDDCLYGNTVLETVWSYYKEVNFSKLHCASVSGLCIDKNTLCPIGNLFPIKNGRNYTISDHIRMRYNKNISGDKCEFYLSDVLKRYPFPVYPNEKFLTESIVWNRIGREYNTLYCNDYFMEKVYLQDGLTAKLVKLFNNNMIGYSDFYNESSIRPFSLKIQLLHTSNYIRVMLCRGYTFRAAFLTSRNKCLFLPALLVILLRKNRNIV